jgi:hypothetical protein
MATLRVRNRNPNSLGNPVCLSVQMYGTYTVVIILPQCTHNVKSKLENKLGYATLEMNDDVVLGLLRQLKQMAFASGGVQHPFWTLQIVVRRLLAINQGLD